MHIIDGIHAIFGRRLCQGHVAFFGTVGWRIRLLLLVGARFGRDANVKQGLVPSIAFIRWFIPLHQFLYNGRMWLGFVGGSSGSSMMRRRMVVSHPHDTVSFLGRLANTVQLVAKALDVIQRIQNNQSCRITTATAAAAVATAFGAGNGGTNGPIKGSFQGTPSLFFGLWRSVVLYIVGGGKGWNGRAWRRTRRRIIIIRCCRRCCRCRFCFRVVAVVNGCPLFRNNDDPLNDDSLGGKLFLARRSRGGGRCLTATSQGSFGQALCDC